MTTSRFLAALVMLAPALLLGAQDPAPHSYVPPDGFVPDAVTAVRIAVAVWIPIYGAKQIETEKPFTATLTGGVWAVSGSLPAGANLGGAAYAEIAKADGRIIRVTHGK
jgi:hypothetical protein